METRHSWAGSPPDGVTPSTTVATVAGLLGLVLSLGAALLSLWCATHASSLLAPSAPLTTPAVGVEMLASAGAAVVAGWLALLLLAGAVEALPRHRLVPLRALGGRLAPQLAPRIAAGLIGSVLLIGSAGAAQAQGPRTDGEIAHSGAVTDAEIAHPDPGAEAVSVTGTRPAPEPGWRPTSSPAHPRDASAIELVSRGTAEPDTVVVRAGDTLWDLAARHLGPEADAAAIAAAWPRWHEANREAIGADPHLLLPGTVLVPPESAHQPTEVAS